MSEPLRFLLELVDKASGPAKAVTRALKSVKTAIEKVDVGKALGKVGSSLASAGKSVGKFGKQFATGIIPYATAALTFVEGALLGIGTVVAKFALQQFAAREDAHLAIGTILGDARKADAAFAGIKGISNLLGKDPREIEQQLLRLVNKGHSVADAFKIIQGAADLKVLGHDADALINAFGELDDKGKISAESLAQLSKAGLDPKRFRDILKNAIGSTGDLQADIAAGIKAGTVDAATLQSAALKTITEMTGRDLGGLAKEQSHTLGGLLERLVTLPARILEGLDASGILEPIKQGFENILAIIEGPEGQAAVAGFVDAFGTIAKTIAGLATPQNLTQLVHVLSRVGEIVFAIAKAFGGPFVTSLVAAFGPLKTVMMLADGNSTSIATFMKGIRILGYIVGGVVAAIVYGFLAIGYIVGVVVGALGTAVEWIVAKAISIDAGLHAAMASVRAWLTGAWTSIVGFFTGIPDTLYNAGVDIVSGLWDGIKATWAWMIGQFDKLVALLPASVKKVLGIASPSKVMMGLGAYTAQGFSMGLEQGGADPRAIFGDVAPPPAITAAKLAGSTSNSQRVGAVNVYVTAPEGSDAAAFGRVAGGAARREIIGLLEAMAVTGA